MKLQGIVGKGTGKLGASVWGVRNGEQIVREYTNKVTNPNTDAQVKQRAKFKLLSQLGQILAGALLLMPKGAESKRNRFMSLNMPAIQWDDELKTAIANFAEMRISEGRAPITAIRTSNGNNINVEVGGDWDGIALGILTAPQLGTLFGGGVIVNETTTTVPMPAPLQQRTTILVAAFRFADSAARAKYSEMTQGQTATEIKVAVEKMFNDGEIITSATVVAQTE